MLAVAAIVFIHLCGCVHTKAILPDGTEFKRTAILYPFKLEAIECDPQTGLVTILGYDTDGGSKTAEAVARGVTSALLKAGIAP
jgi:hypothetical protein